MKVISLNTWGGRGGVENLLAFFERYSDTDIFCLQEIWNGGEEMVGVQAGGVPLSGVSTTLLPDIASVLTNHSVFFRPHFKDYYGLAMLVKNSLPVIEEGELFVYKDRGYVHTDERGNHARNIQYVTLETAHGPRTVINFHGLWNGKGKTDSEDRLVQSANILTFLESLNHPFVLCGDFNLLPKTESLKRLEEYGLRNLITENNITSTRTSFYTKPDKFADYALVGGGITVHDFRVLPEEVSDHAALMLNFE